MRVHRKGAEVAKERKARHDGKGAVASATARILMVFILGLLAGCAGGGGIERVRDVVFTPPDWPVAVPGDVYRPVGEELTPAVLLVHGGGWTGGDTRWHMNRIARKLARSGYFVLNVTYRQAPDWTYPAPVEDLREALKWLWRNAEAERIDVSRIAVFGYSAGGYLGAMVGLDGDSGVRAIVAGAAPSDLTFYRDGDLVAQFLGARYHEAPALFHDASPVNHVTTKSPPVFLYHGEEDELVKLEHTLAMVAALEVKGVPHKVFWIPGRGHIGAFLRPAGSVDAAIEFLDRYLR